MSEPKIYTRNYVDDESVISSSHGSTFLEYLFDRDKDSQYVTTGANSDATEATITVIFKEASNEINRTIDRLILLNHNLEDPILEYWNGSAWTSLDSETNLVSGIATVMDFNSVTTSRIRIRNSETITPNQEKMVGELIACAIQVSFSFTVSGAGDIVSYQPSSRQMETEVRLADGSIHRTFIKHTVNRIHKYESRVQFDYLTTSELASLKAIKETGDVFLWQPESVNQPDEIYLVHWVGPFTWRYSSNVKTSGVQVTLDLREV